uniref:Uncharacterized protein n=1 Tax=Ascaris lumbricoides TaxID=6252 RepID=A0A0M3IQS9_ASCLU
MIYCNLSSLPPSPIPSLIPFFHSHCALSVGIFNESFPTGQQCLPPACKCFILSTSGTTFIYERITFHAVQYTVVKFPINKTKLSEEGMPVWSNSVVVIIGGGGGR